MVIVTMFPTQPKLALAVFIAYTHHTCVSNKKNTVSGTVWMTWNLVHETSIAMFGAQIKHTIWNSSQSYPISVKLEKKLFHHFIVSEMWISNETKKKQIRAKRYV